MDKKITEHMDKEINVGDYLLGDVVHVEEKFALLDIGYKWDAILPIKEVANVNIDKVSDLIRLNDKLNVKVIKIDEEKEKLIVSKRIVDQENAWKLLPQKKEQNETLIVKCLEVVKGGIIADIGVRAFIPISQLEEYYVEDLNKYIGLDIPVKIIEVNLEKNKVILSHRAYLKEQKEIEYKKKFSNIKIGEILTGTVKSITEYGAFVDIGNIEGLLHVSEIAWKKLKPSDLLHVNDKIKVKVIDVNSEKNKVSLSMKALEEKPFIKLKNKLKIGDIVIGRVTKILAYGVIVELFPEFEGFVHISQISDKPINNPKEVLAVGDEVKVKIIDFDLEKEKVMLSIKEAIEREEINYNFQDIKSGFTIEDVIGKKLNELKKRI